MSTLPAHGEVVGFALGGVDGEPAHDVSALRRELATQRSANAALLAALRDLETSLRSERERVDALEFELGRMDPGEDAELSRQRTVARNLLQQLEEARQALEEERTKSLPKRLLGR